MVWRWGEVSKRCCSTSTIALWDRSMTWRIMLAMVTMVRETKMGKDLEGGEEEGAVGDGVQLVVGEVEVGEGGQAHKHKGVEHLVFPHSNFWCRW